MNRKQIIRNLRARNIAFDPNASTADLQALLNGAQNRVNKTFNFAKGKGKIEVVFNAEKTDEPAEIMICEEIGKDPWSGEGIGVKDIQSALNEITPKTRPLNFLTNSPGGSVSEGTSIRNILQQWPGRITNTIIGIAASTASWMIPADETRAYKSSQMFLHRSWGMVVGNADEMRSAIAFLETTDKQISEILADQSDCTPDEMMDLMKKESLLTGQQAKDLGLVDTIIDGESKNQFTPEWINAAKQKLAALNSTRSSATPEGVSAPSQGAEEPTQNKNAQIVMNRTQMIALLNKWGVKIPDNATDEQLQNLIEAGKPATPAPAPAQNTVIKHGDTVVDVSELLEAQKEIKNFRAESRRASIRNQLKVLVSEDKIAAPDVDAWLQTAYDAQDDPVKGNPVLNQLNALQPRQPGASPLNTPSTGEFNRLEVGTADIKDIIKGYERFNEASDAYLKRGVNIGTNKMTPMEVIRNQAVEKANFFRKFENRFREVYNTNTIATELKRNVILQTVIRDFARRLTPLNLFSSVFANVPLEGTNKVEVPFYDLDTSASTSFVSGTGYTTIGNTATDVREITIGEGATNGDRLYQALGFTSQEIARQPYLKIAELTKLKAEKLASDIWTDVLGIILASNYGAAAVTQPAAMFTSDNIADLKVACKTWPEVGRGLILASEYDGNLLKDPAFKSALNAASDLAIKEGRLYPRVMGFDYVENPNIPSNSENLVGFAVFMSAILFATAPVPPVEEVRNAGTVWEMITDPQTGISFEYRRFGNNVTDAATNVIECSYGFAKGNGNALKRIVSAAV